MKYSLIIPVYNRPEEVDELLESLVAQQFADFEVLVVEDGSTLPCREVVDVVSDASTETVLYADVPTKVVLKITYTEPGLKGDTATNTLKPATVETGATVRVPLFVNEGEMIEVDTRDGSYLGRVK